MTLIKNGRVVTEREVRAADLRFENGRIAQVAPGLEPAGNEEVIDATGRMVLPGMIDPHLHIKLDTGIYGTPDDWSIGTRQAALGGITTVLDFATQFPHQDFTAGFEHRTNEIRGRSCIDYALHMMITDRRKAGSMEALRDLGVNSIKIYTTYRPNYFQDDHSMLEIMRAAAALDLIVMVHAENDAIVAGATSALMADGKTGLAYHGCSRPEIAEPEAAHRCAFLARETGAELYVVHNSSPATVDVITEARQRGQRIWSETCPQYLTLDDSVYAGPEPHRFILQPPLRSAASREGLWRRVSAGAVDVLGTDHCDYSLAQKTEHATFMKTPGGLPGLETFFPLMHHFGVNGGRIDWPDLVRLCSSAAARIFRLWPRKGSLQVGADADLVLFDPSIDHVVAPSRYGTAGYSPWQGVEVRGMVTDVWLRGRRLVTDRDFVGGDGMGEYLTA